MSDDGARARWFHQETKHSLESVRANQHRLIWENQPRPFKLYTDAESVALADLAPDSRIHALDALSNPFPADAPSSPLTTSLLSSLLHYSAGITKTINHFGQAMQFRAAACTGALYHVDVYAVTGELNGLDAGVYQFGPQDGQLRRLRSGDFRSALIEACGGQEHARRSDAMLVLSTTFWRNSWKYQARAYRHAFWDSGTMVANTLGVARAHDLRASVVLGFNDDAVNALLGLDAEREVAIALVALGESSTQAPPSPSVEPISLETVPYSAYEVPEPLILDTHRATSLSDNADVAAWRTRATLVSSSSRPSQESVPLSEDASRPIEDVIRRRGSARRFQRSPISMDHLDALLYASTQGIPCDVLGASTSETTSLYLIANAVSGMSPGAYVYTPATHSLETLRTGDARSQAGYLDLGQELAADAALNVYVLSDLERVFATMGDRGYRVAHLEASIISGKLYLASYALNLAATGLTFFDDDVIQFFSPHADGKSVMFLTAIGNRAPSQAGPGIER